MPTEQRSISQMMKEGCADLHEKAEHATIPARMVSGQMSRDEYVAMLQQGVLWNRELDVAILESRPTSPYLTALVDDAQLQGPYYDADLKHFGSKAATEPSPGVVALCKDIEKADPLTLLGLHYVREGANNGNRYVAKKLRAAWGVEGSDGFRSLDPYGEDQRPRWETFKTTLDAQPFSEMEKARLVEAGRLMFTRIMAIHDDLANQLELAGA
ncbi:MAG: biliverdin-producing heme oxygenase [Phycisphaerales bacterium]|nr:biliverdin-producing heme oxygenase [Phycisphaerales bacterium]